MERNQGRSIEKSALLSSSSISSTSAHLNLAIVQAAFLGDKLWQRVRRRWQRWRAKAMEVGYYYWWAATFGPIAWGIWRSKWTCWAWRHWPSWCCHEPIVARYMICSLMHPGGGILPLFAGQHWMHTLVIWKKKKFYGNYKLSFLQWVPLSDHALKACLMQFGF